MRQKRGPRGTWMAVALAASTLMACAHKGDEAIASRWLDAMNSHDPSEVLALMADDAVYRDPGSGNDIARGRLTERLELEWYVWRDQVFTATHVYETADASVIEWHVQQTHSSGKHIEFDGVTVLSTSAGTIRAIRTYYNASLLLQFLPKQE